MYILFRINVIEVFIEVLIVICYVVDIVRFSVRFSLIFFVYEFWEVLYFGLLVDLVDIVKFNLRLFFMW